MKKPPSKFAQKKNSPIAAKMAQIEEFMFQNVAYRPTVYITGTKMNNCDYAWFVSTPQLNKVKIITRF